MIKNGLNFKDMALMILHEYEKTQCFSNNDGLDWLSEQLKDIYEVGYKHGGQEFQTADEGETIMTNEEYPLTPKQAREALAELGTVVENEEGQAVKYDLFGVLNYAKKEGGLWEFCNIAPTEGKWRIVKPEPKRLTFEEALACDGVHIEVPEHITRYDGKYRCCKNYGSSQWRIEQVLILDLAERRGWPIYEVTE